MAYPIAVCRLRARNQALHDLHNRMPETVNDFSKTIIAHKAGKAFDLL
jgi:hypothetical protein